MINKRISQISELLFEKRGIFPVLVSLGIGMVSMFILMFPLIPLIVFSENPESTDGMGIILLIFLILLIPTLIISMFTQVGMMNSMKKIQNGEEFKLSQFFKGTSQYFWSYLGRSIAAGFIVSILLLPVVLLLVPITMVLGESILAVFLQQTIITFISSFFAVYIYIYITGTFYKTSSKEVMSAYKKELFILAIALAFLMSIPLLGYIFSMMAMLIYPYSIILFSEYEKENEEDTKPNSPTVPKELDSQQEEEITLDKKDSNE